MASPLEQSINGTENMLYMASHGFGLTQVAQKLPERREGRGQSVGHRGSCVRALTANKADQHALAFQGFRHDVPVALVRRAQHRPAGDLNESFERGRGGVDERRDDFARARLAALLDVTDIDVFVKGKTNESMGWIGREEGLAVMATATVLPRR